MKGVSIHLRQLAPAVLVVGGLTVACFMYDRDWAGYGYIASVNVVVMAFYMWDKKMAAAGGRRIPEAVLHLLALLGGTVGALAGQRIFRHKTRKIRFQMIFWFIVMLHTALAAVSVRQWYGSQNRFLPVVLNSALGCLVVMNIVALLIYSQGGRSGRGGRNLACGISVLGGGALGAVIGDMRRGSSAKFAYLVGAAYLGAILILAMRAAQALLAGLARPI